MEDRYDALQEKDLLRMFINDMGRYGVLTREEENVVQNRIKLGDPAALNQLIQSNIRFALKIVFCYWKPGYPLMEMISGACFGLVMAGKTFNPEAGVRFITYAFRGIEQQVKMAMIENDLALCESLDVPIYEGGECLKDHIASEEKTPEEEAETTDLSKYLSVLSSKERYVIKMRFWGDKTLDEIGLAFGVRREWVRQIEARALMKLRFLLRGTDIQWQ